MKYELNPEKKFQFIMAFILDQLIDKRDFPIVMEKKDSVLKPTFMKMMELNMVKIEGLLYKITPKGQEFMDNFFKKYEEFLKFYDIFCAVDLANGTFAFSKFFDFETDEEWEAYLGQSNFDDVRVAVCEFKKIDPIEVVFMSFINEGRFNSNDWQFYLINDLLWYDILEICNTAIQIEELIEDGVLEDIVKQGSEIMMTMLKEESVNKLADLKADEEVTEETYTEEVTYVEEEIAYYDPYLYDPYYISPCWGLLFLL